MSKIHLNKIVKKFFILGISVMLATQIASMASSAAADGDVNGDVNGDGTISVIDLVAAREDNVTTEQADLNDDGKVNGEDYHMIREGILNAPHELDGVMEVLDITISGTNATVIMKNTSSVWEAEGGSVIYTYGESQQAAFELGNVKPGVTKTYQITVPENVTEITVTKVEAEYWSATVK